MVGCSGTLPVRELQVLRGLHEQDWPRIQQLAVEVHTPELRRSVQALAEQHFDTVSVYEDKALVGTGLAMLYASEPR